MNTRSGRRSFPQTTKSAASPGAISPSSFSSPSTRAGRQAAARTASSSGIPKDTARRMHSNRSVTDPARVLSVYRGPLIAPDTPIETDEGFRENVIFPCGMVAEDDGEIKIYYGASDTCVCIATAKTDDLLALLT